MSFIILGKGFIKPWRLYFINPDRIGIHFPDQVEPSSIGFLTDTEFIREHSRITGSHIDAFYLKIRPASILQNFYFFLIGSEYIIFFTFISIKTMKYQAYTNNTQNSCHDADCKSFFHVLHLRLPYNRYIFFQMLIHPFASFYNECFHLFYITIIERIISIIPFITISNPCAA